MCYYEGAKCIRANGKPKPCLSENKVNYNQPIEWTGKCQNNEEQNKQRAWTLLVAPPDWMCGEPMLIDAKKIRYEALCGKCKAARKAKVQRRRENKRQRAEERRTEVERLKNESAESSRQSTPMELKRRYTFGAAATQTLLLLKLRRLMRMRAQAEGGDNVAVLRRSETSRSRAWV